MVSSASFYILFTSLDREPPRTAPRASPSSEASREHADRVCDAHVAAARPAPFIWRNRPPGPRSYGMYPTAPQTHAPSRVGISSGARARHADLVTRRACGAGRRCLLAGRLQRPRTHQPTPSGPSGFLTDAIDVLTLCDRLDHRLPVHFCVGSVCLVAPPSALLHCDEHSGYCFSSM